jgi:hypothetical protein
MEKIMRPWRVLTIVALFLCSFLGFGIEGAAQTAAKSSASVASGDQRARFAGTYRYAGGAQEDDARKAAIDHGVESLSVFTRSTARSRVQATTQIPGSYAFSFEPGKIIVRPEGRPDVISGDKGESADYVYNGKKSTVSQVIAGDRITQVFVSDDGKRQNEFTLSQDGQVLTLKVTVTSARLSNPVVYSLTYKKAN